MPELGRVDYSPILGALGARGSAQQANYAEQFEDLKAKENTRQAVAGAIDGVFKLGELGVKMWDQARLEKMKPVMVQFQRDANTQIQNAIASGDYETLPDGSVKLGAAFTDWYKKSRDELPKEAKSGNVSRWMQDQMDDTYTGLANQAEGMLINQAKKESLAATDQNIATAMDMSVASQDMAPLRDVLDSAAFISPQAKETAWIGLQKTYGMKVSAKEASAAAVAGGMGEADKYLEGTVWGAEEKGAIRAAAGAAARAAITNAFDATSVSYDTQKAAGPDAFMPDAFIKGELEKLPVWMRADVEEGLRKKQSADNIMAGTEQFNIDRDNPSLSYLKGQYERLQASPKYDGDESTRSTVMSWYEHLIGNISSTGTGVSKKVNEDALKVLDSQVTLWTSGAGGVSGYAIMDTIERFKGDGSISAAQANTYRDRVTVSQFPQAKPFLANAEATAKSLLGIKTPDAKLTAEERTRIIGLSSTISEKVSDMLLEEGGAITPARMTQIFDTVKAITASKALDEVRVGFSLFKRPEKVTEESIAKSKAALDSPEGQAAVFTDKSGKVQFLGKDPGQIQSVIETVSQYEQDLLEARGIKVATASFEPEGLYDVTGSKIYSASDGTQYRFRTEGGRMVAFSRNTPDGSWKKAFTPSIEGEAAKKAKDTEQSRLEAEVGKLRAELTGLERGGMATGARAKELRTLIEKAQAAADAFRAGK